MQKDRLTRSSSMGENGKKNEQWIDYGLLANTQKLKEALLNIARSTWHIVDSDHSEVQVRGITYCRVETKNGPSRVSILKMGAHTASLEMTLGEFGAKRIANTHWWTYGLASKNNKQIDYPKGPCPSPKGHGRALWSNGPYYTTWEP